MMLKRITKGYRRFAGWMKRRQDWEKKALGSAAAVLISGAVWLGNQWLRDEAEAQIRVIDQTMKRDPVAGVLYLIATLGNEGDRSAVADMNGGAWLDGMPWPNVKSNMPPRFEFGPKRPDRTVADVQMSVQFTPELFAQVSRGDRKLEMRVNVTYDQTPSERVRYEFIGAVDPLAGFVMLRGETTSLP